LPSYAAIGYDDIYNPFFDFGVLQRASCLLGTRFGALEVFSKRSISSLAMLFEKLEDNYLFRSDPKQKLFLI
jgi:hypothetical protein